MTTIIGLVLQAVALSVVVGAVLVVWLLVRRANGVKLIKLPPMPTTEAEKARITRRGYTVAAVKEMKRIDAIIIGSGMGGLTTGALMARDGKSVLVLEQHDVAGGCTHSFVETKGGHKFEFDTGTHYVGAHVNNEKHPLHKLFKTLTNGEVEWAPMADAYDIMKLGDEEIRMVSGEKRYVAELKKHFPDPDDQAAIDNYIALRTNCEKVAAPLFFVANLLPKWLRFLAPLMKMPAQKYINVSTRVHLEKLTKNQKLIGVLTYMFGDYGLPPAQSPFLIHAGVSKHYSEGAAYPVGGSETLARSAVRVIESAGGRVLVRCKVDKIIVKDGAAKGVQTSKGHKIMCDNIISGAGAYNTYCNLLDVSTQKTPAVMDILTELTPGLNLAHRDLRFDQVLQPGASHISLFVGMDASYAELELPASNYWCFPHADHDKTVEAYYMDDTMETDFPAFFISFPGAKDPTWDERFPGRSTALIVTEAPYHWFAKWKEGRVRHRGEEYDAIKKKLSDRMLKNLYKYAPTIEGHVVYHELGTPLSNEHYLGATEGASYGLSLSKARFQSKVNSPYTPIKGLTLSGQDAVMPGLAGALMGGAMCTASAAPKTFVKHLHLIV